MRAACRQKPHHRRQCRRTPYTAGPYPARSRHRRQPAAASLHGGAISLRFPHRPSRERRIPARWPKWTSPACQQCMRMPSLPRASSSAPCPHSHQHTPCRNQRITRQPPPSILRQFVYDVHHSLAAHRRVLVRGGKRSLRQPSARENRHSYWRPLSPLAKEPHQLTGGEPQPHQFIPPLRTPCPTTHDPRTPCPVHTPPTPRTPRTTPPTPDAPHTHLQHLTRHRRPTPHTPLTLHAPRPAHTSDTSPFVTHGPVHTSEPAPHARLRHLIFHAPRSTSQPPTHQPHITLFIYISL